MSSAYLVNKKNNLFHFIKVPYIFTVHNIVQYTHIFFFFLYFILIYFIFSIHSSNHKFTVNILQCKLHVMWHTVVEENTLDRGPFYLILFFHPFFKPYTYGVHQGSSTKTAWGPVMNPPHQPRSGELYIKKQLMFFLPGQGICRIFKLKFKTFFKTCTKKKKKKKTVKSMIYSSDAGFHKNNQVLY